MPDQELIAFMLQAAVSLSGYGPVPAEELPAFVPVSRAELVREVCPEDQRSCENLAAVFDTDGYRILYLESLDIESASDNSFLVHELVHVLQFRRDGDRIFATCDDTLRTEQEAYRVQNAYLKRQGQLLRYGRTLAFASCAGSPGTLYSPPLPK